MANYVSVENKKLISKYPFKFTPLSGMIPLSEIGLQSGAYGGRAHSAAKVRDKDLILIVDSSLNTIDILENASEADEESTQKNFVRRGRKAV